MRGTQQFNITLPTDLAEIVEKKIESGSYASVSDLVHDGLRALLDRDEGVDRWLREEVTQAYDAYRANPDMTVSSNDIMERIRERARRRRDLRRDDV